MRFRHGVDRGSDYSGSDSICGSDILASGAIKYCHTAGIPVSGEVSIVGPGNLEIAELTSPELTTLEVPARDMGRVAAD